MENSEIKDWKDYNLDKDEIEMLESVERGEWTSIGNIEERRQRLRDYFSTKSEPSRNVNIYLNKNEFEKLLEKSSQYNMNYQELIEKLIHNFTSGKIIL